MLRSKILLKVRSGKGVSEQIQINYLSGEQSGRASADAENFGPLWGWISIRSFPSEPIERIQRRKSFGTLQII